MTEQDQVLDSDGLAYRVRTITEHRAFWGKHVDIETNPYAIGMYNGLELALSIIQNRKPEYKRRRN